MKLINASSRPPNAYVLLFIKHRRTYKYGGKTPSGTRVRYAIYSDNYKLIKLEWNNPISKKMYPCEKGTEDSLDKTT